MIPNGKGNKQKYDANKVMVGNVSVVDYINNKILKLQNDIAEFTPNILGFNVNDTTMALTTSYQALSLSTANTKKGNFDMFKINNDNIEFLGTNVLEDRIITHIGLTMNIVNDTFTTGDRVDIKISVVDSNNTEKNASYMFNTMLEKDDSRQNIYMTLNTTLVKGDKISINIKSINAKNIKINKTQIFIINQISIPTDYLKFHI